MKHLMLGFLLLVPSLLMAAPNRLDSLGVEKKDGQLYILHRVNQGQTLYALVRRYNASVQSIKDANPGMDVNLRYDQIVRVPVTGLSRKEEKSIVKELRKEEKEQKREERKAEKAGEPAGTHRVATGETLYSIATRYGVSTDDLRKWNRLPGETVPLGGTLIVSEKTWQESGARAEAPKTEAPKPVAKPESTKVAAPAPAPRPKTEKADVAVASRAEAVPERSRPLEPGNTPSEPRLIRPGDPGPLPNPGAGARKIAEIGVAEIIDESDNSNKYLALHRSAPIGTLVLVRNDLNNQSIWVKVIGRLPQTTLNDKVIIKISARAFEKLSPADRRFRAEVSYLDYKE